MLLGEIGVCGSRLLPKPTCLLDEWPAGSPHETPDVVFRTISDLKQTLAERFDQLARKMPVGPVGELVRRLRS